MTELRWQIKRYISEISPNIIVILSDEKDINHIKKYLQYHFAKNKIANIFLFTESEIGDFNGT